MKIQVRSVKPRQSSFNKSPQLSIAGWVRWVSGCAAIGASAAVLGSVLLIFDSAGGPEQSLLAKAMGAPKVPSKNGTAIVAFSAPDKVSLRAGSPSAAANLESIAEERIP